MPSVVRGYVIRHARICHPSCADMLSVMRGYVIRLSIYANTRYILCARVWVDITITCGSVENVIENESHFSLEVVDQDLSSLAMFTKHFMGEQRKRVVSFGVGEGKEEFMGGIGGGSFAIRSMVAKDGLGGDGLVVDGGRSPSTSSRDREDGGVANKSSMGSRLIVTSEVSLDSWVGAGGGEVNGGGVVLGVSKQFSFELVFIGDSGGEIIGEVGGAPNV
ncbi:hypothetical protein Tco_1110869 [Tanacetum coccineum]|uniref:Uncharacterized protein n=1 Tax=Tanacetum coccineum TaxID=301880 RepID=A0ABQ5IL88_9ASTR